MKSNPYADFIVKCFGYTGQHTNILNHEICNAYELSRQESRKSGKNYRADRF